MQLEDWSGADTGVNTPKEVINGARTFLYYNVRTLRPVICWQDTWASQKAGLGQFKLTVSIGLTNFDNTGVSFGAQVLVMQHQWLAGWMSLNAPTLDEVTSRDPAHNPEGLGDPKGDGNFFAGDNWVQQADGTWIYDKYAHPGEIRATVKGTLPLGQDFSELGLGASITLPDQWAALAGALATDADPTNANPAMRWDIHDEMVDENGNAVAAPVGSGVGGRSDPTHDAVVSIRRVPVRWPAHVERRRARSRASSPRATATIPFAGRATSRRPARSTRTTQSRPCFLTDTWTRATPRCRLPGSTSRSLRTRTRSPRLTVSARSSTSTSRRCTARTTRATTRSAATCSRRSTRSTSRQPLVIRSATPPALTAR